MARDRRSNPDIDAGVAPDPEVNGEAAIGPTILLPPGPDIPGFEGVPEELRDQLLRIRRDPTQEPPVHLQKQPEIAKVEPPRKDDIFRTFPDPERGWFPVDFVYVDKASRKKTYVVGKGALENPVVKARSRPGSAILTCTTEGVLRIWCLALPDVARARNSYPYDKAKWECATAGMEDFVTFTWHDKSRQHKWKKVVPKPGEKPFSEPDWPAAEVPFVTILKALREIFVDDPDFEEFRNLVDWEDD